MIDWLVSVRKLFYNYKMEKNDADHSQNLLMVIQQLYADKSINGDQRDQLKGNPWGINI